MSAWLERQPPAIQFLFLTLLLIVPTLLVPLAVELWW
jgi:hypothetical protein